MLIGLAVASVISLLWPTNYSDISVNHLHMMACTSPLIHRWQVRLQRADRCFHLVSCMLTYREDFVLHSMSSQQAGRKKRCASVLWSRSKLDVMCGWTAGLGIMCPCGVMGSVIGVRIIRACRRQKMGAGGVVVQTGEGITIHLGGFRTWLLMCLWR